LQIGIQMLREAAERRVTSPAATDLTVDLRGTPRRWHGRVRPETGGGGALARAAVPHPDVDPRCDWTCTGFRPRAIELDQPFALKRVDPDDSRFALLQVQDRRPGPLRRPPGGPRVSDVSLYEFPKFGQPSNPGTDGRFVAVNRKLR
jgi:hypothetical protein